MTVISPVTISTFLWKNDRLTKAEMFRFGISGVRFITMYDYFFILVRSYTALTTVVCTVLSGALMHGLTRA